MDLALLITNILLVSFTGIYVLLTYKRSKESINNNKINLLVEIIGHRLWEQLVKGYSL